MTKNNALKCEHFAVVVSKNKILKQNLHGDLPKISKFVSLPS